jgi:endonuclease G
MAKREDVLRQIYEDQALREEILNQILENPEIGEELVTPHLEEVPRGAEGLERIRTPVSSDHARRIFETARGVPILEDLAPEAIIRRLGRPVLKIRNDDFDARELGTDVWKERLEGHRENLKTAILSVGRIEVENNPYYSWLGTGWVIADDVIVTNRHVAREFARRSEQRFVFRSSFLGEMEARLDFREEHLGGNPIEFSLAEVLHVEDEAGPDVAFLRIDWGSNPSGEQRSPIPLSERVSQDHYVVVIGYPAKDTRTLISNEMDIIFGNIYDVKRLAPGQIMQIFEEEGLFTHDCTTLGGNSGSVVYDMESGEALGLHFAGREESANYAVSALIIKERFEDLHTVPGSTFAAIPVPHTEPEEEAPSLASMQDRTGYDPSFLGSVIPLPNLSSDLQQHLAPVVDRNDGMLHYNHYSVMMHSNRRIAIYTVCNIDGARWRRIPRGRDKWYFDPRMDRAYQVGNELYKSNKLDRGHLVRRLDPAWGETYEDAKRANDDTFFYTNCAPQHKQINQDLWLGLEDYILANTDVYDLKVSVFNGPIFRETDRVYRGFMIPEDFWKIVVMVREETGNLSATAYMLSQLDFMDDLEFAFGPYRTYQVPIMQIEGLTGLNFGNLKLHDPLAEQEILPYIQLDTLERIVI